MKIKELYTSTSNLPTTLDDGQLAIVNGTDELYIKDGTGVKSAIQEGKVPIVASLPTIGTSQVGKFYQLQDGSFYIGISNSIPVTDASCYWFLLNSSNGDNRGVFAGGINGGNYRVKSIEQINITTASNANAFGGLTGDKQGVAATSNATNGRCVVGGGDEGGKIYDVDYFTLVVESNAADFGDLTVARTQLNATSNATNERGVFAGGYGGGTTDIIDYITISTLGNATDFGDMDDYRYDLCAFSNGTNNRGVFAGGYDGNNYLNTIDYINITSTGNASSFGYLSSTVAGLDGFSNATNERGVFAGGDDDNLGACTNVIEYITISTTGNATDFGDLETLRYQVSGTSNATNERGVIAGGYDGSIAYDEMNYVTINIPSNSSYFGDLIQPTYVMGATSNAN